MIGYVEPLWAQFGPIGWTELLIGVLVVLLLFGTRLPSVMRSLGQGVTEFKKGLQGQPDEPERVKRSDGPSEPPRDAGV